MISWSTIFMDYLLWTPWSSIQLSWQLPYRCGLSLQLSPAKTEFKWFVPPHRRHSYRQISLWSALSKLLWSPWPVTLASISTVTCQWSRTLCGLWACALASLDRSAVFADWCRILHWRCWCPVSSCLNWTTAVSPSLVCRAATSTDCSPSSTLQHDSQQERGDMIPSRRCWWISTGCRCHRGYNISSMFPCTVVYMGLRRATYKAPSFLSWTRHPALCLFRWPRRCLTMGDHAFALSGPRAWNKLPDSVRPS